MAAKTGSCVNGRAKNAHTCDNHQFKICNEPPLGGGSCYVEKNPIKLANSF